MDINKFKQEHEEIVASVAALRELTHKGVAENAAAIVKQIVAMRALIRSHLAAEEEVLYPAIAGSKDPAISKIGQMYQQEMGGIASAYLKFVERWSIKSKLAGDPSGFKEEANKIFKALHQRIQRENQELYPMANRV